MSDKQTASKDAILKAIDRCRHEDFDGTVDWHSLSFEQKLRWIVQSARFVLAYGSAPK